MTDSRFLRISNKVINVNAIAYVDFLESGRSMILIQGLTQEKQNIPVDADETRKLRAFFDAQVRDAFSSTSTGPERTF